MSFQDNQAAQTQLVKPDNGRRETIWVTLVVILILLAGALGIMFRQAGAAPADPYESLNGAQRQLLTELTIASDEIRFMTPSSTPWPELDELQTLGVSPFAQTDDAYDWKQVEPGCFQAQDRSEQGAFLLVLEAGGSILFHPGQAPLLSDCNDQHHWTLLMELQ
ncbi:DUF6162 family protein [Nitrincola sp. MINF-07-Sa-05]|uniref:DUF6162 family protein n=1 Tax=Nitrincola salilacus TaxID=3400273 RepID=UPI003917D363